MSNCAQRCTRADSREPWEQEYLPPSRATRCRSLWPHGQSLNRICHIQNASVTFCRKIKLRFLPQDGPSRGFHRTPYLNLISQLRLDRLWSKSLLQYGNGHVSLLLYTWIFWLCNKHHIFSSKVSSCNERSWTSGRKTVHLINLPAVTLHSGR